MKITAALITGLGEPFQIAEVDLDEPRSDEILVRLAGTGVCHSDLVFRDNVPTLTPAVLGHEGAGVVEKVGADVKTVAPGDHVVLSYNYCNRCNNCHSGRPFYCENHMFVNYSGMREDGSHTLSMDGTPLHGSFFAQSSFATYSLALEKNTVKVPKDVPVEILGPLGCGVQTGAGAVINTLNVQAGSSIAVFGMGTVGLSALMAAKVLGCSIIIGVDINPERLRLAAECGATHVVNAKEAAPVPQIHAITEIGVDYAVEASGIPEVFQQSFAALNPTGTSVLLGVAPLGSEVTFDMNMMLMGRTIKGVIEGESVPHLLIPKMVQLYKQGIFPFDKLIKFYSLSDINKAVEDSITGKTIKPVIRFDI